MPSPAQLSSFFFFFLKAFQSMMMKSSLGKQLKRFALNQSAAKERKEDHHFISHVDVLSQASQDMKDMRNCCDSLLSAAAATINSAYEFSESLLEMGSCFMERIALVDNEECGRALSVLGQLQLELQKLVDHYRTHVIETITNPSESLLSELRKVEEMKLQCDEKREMYEHLVTQHREKGKSKSGKGESFTTQQHLQAAREEYDEVTRLCVFRVESLKKGQCHSILTQAARHHTAQLIFFRSGLKSLESVEPFIRSVAQNQHIDCEVSEVAADGDDGGNRYDPRDDGELSFDNRLSKEEQENACTSRNSMEVDQEDAAGTQGSGLEDLEQLDFGKRKVDQLFIHKSHVSSHSAPIYAEKKPDISERLKEVQAPAPKIVAYALPTPSDAQTSTSKRAASVLHSTGTSISGNNNNLWHSSPLDNVKPMKQMDDSLGGRHVSKARSVVKDSNNIYPSVPLPSPLDGGISPPQFDILHSSHDARKVERQAFSGPLLSKQLSSRNVFYSSGPIGPTEAAPQSYSGLFSRTTNPQPPSALFVPQSVSPPHALSPRFGELHELPRPPVPSLGSKQQAGSGVIGHSAPLMSRIQEQSPTNKYPLLVSNTGSMLPLPPVVSFARSLSVPSNNHGAAAGIPPVTKLKDSPGRDKPGGGLPSPPLATPNSLSNMGSTTVSSQLPPAIGRHIKGKS